MTPELHYLVIEGTNERECLDVHTQVPKIYDSWELAESARQSYSGLMYVPIAVEDYHRKYAKYMKGGMAGTPSTRNCEQV